MAFKKHDIQRFEEQLPNGRDVTVVGNPEGFRKYNHQQGNYGYSGTCGIVSCEDVLHQFGKKASEPKLIAYADQHGLFIDAIGGIDTFGCTKIISDYGVPAKPQFYGNMAQLAQYMEEGRGVIISVNAGDLWQSTDKRDHAEPGRTNHAVVVTGVAYERGTTKIVGFYINDSGTNKSGQFISADIMQLA